VQKEFGRIFGNVPGIVLSDIDASLFECATAQAVCSRSTRRYHNYSCSPLWHYGKPETARLVATGLARATPLYALVLPSKDIDKDIDACH
jgi:hypothetical protein